MNNTPQFQIEQAGPPLPSIQEAIRHSLHAYFEATLDKIATFFGDAPRKSYSDLTTHEIFSRGYFLDYVYQSLMCLQEISKHWSASSPPFKTFLTELFFTADDLTKITRINHICIFEGGSRSPTSQRILELLYETQFYVYQILLRVVLVKMVYEEHERALQEIEAINQRCIFPEYFTQQRKLFASKKDKAKLKHLFAEVESILSYYHCELSLNRSECISRPEVNALLHLLKRKLSQPLLQFVRENINFKCEGDPPINPNTKEKPPATTVKLSPNPPNPPKMPSTPQLEMNSFKTPSQSPKEKECLLPQLVQDPQESQVPSVAQPPQVLQEPQAPQIPQDSLIFMTPPKQPKIRESLESSPQIPRQVQPSTPPQPPPNLPNFALILGKSLQSRSQKVNNNEAIRLKQEQIYPQQVLQTPKREKIPKNSSSNERPIRNSESVSKKSSSQLIQSNLPEFKYERRNDRTPSQKPISKRHSKHQSMKEKMKAFKQMQRFSHAQCNFKYTVPKHKLNRKIQQNSNPDLKKRPQEANPRVAPIVYFNQEKEESDESYLAEQTPVHRNRTYIRPSNPI